MRDLIGTIIYARKTYEAAVSVRGAIVSGGDTDALLRDLDARFRELATTMGYLVEPIDDAAMSAVEGREAAE